VLCVVIPVIVVLAILIRFESTGSPLFRQTRVGKDQEHFVLYKLRTMKLETPVMATHEISPNQITKIGSILRRTRLDEVPQLWNVLIGDMNFVGPRPCLPSQKELIAARELGGVFSVCPGITGLAQIQGIDMSDPARLAIVDREYVEAASLWGDAKLVMLTATRLWRTDLFRSF